MQKIPGSNPGGPTSITSDFWIYKKWLLNTTMQFIELAKVMGSLEKTRSRNEMTEILAEFFKRLDKEDIKRACYLLQGRIAPPFEGLEVGLGEKYVIESIARATGYSQNKVDELYKKKGDLGLVAEELLKRKKQTSLFTKNMEIREVFDLFTKIAKLGGQGSLDNKIAYLMEMFNNAQPIEGRYIARIPIGRLRLGVGDPTLLDSLSLAKKGDRSDREKLERAYNLCSDIGYVAERYYEGKIDDFKVQVFKPLRPALAERLPTAERIIEKLGECFVEAKYDGFRMQCHKKGDKVEIFSRRMEKLTDMVPEIVEAIKREIKVDEIIFEGEGIGYDESENKFYSFQQTIQRKRKHDVNKKVKEIPLKLFAFDVMYINGESLIELPFRERRKRLEEIVKGGRVIGISEGYKVDSAEEIEEHFQDFVSRGLEGLMAKDLNAPYTAGARKFAWIKLKKSYRSELSDTVDIVIVGYYEGKGSRTKFGLGGILGAVYDPDRDEFRTIAKVGSGFSEDQMRELAEKLKKIEVKGKPKRVVAEMEPDHWVEPKYVITVVADEITRSPVHTCGKVGNKPGYALRFPRIVGDIRVDKRPEDATTVEEIVEMYEIQKN